MMNSSIKAISFEALRFNLFADTVLDQLEPLLAEQRTQAVSDTSVQQDERYHSSVAGVPDCARVSVH